mmetsp:Transcript_22500/g.46973  ORF Transcript_22500/g.46973 Transcript_22500/m.46973 type:complete len:195 (-) Transcript_22500:50-634(-)
MAEATIKFTVGGKHFEVSRTPIHRHSDTVLGKLVSDTWNEDRGKTVFIDRDGDIFAHILNYLRYGSIELPVTLPRSMFDRELDYYGIASAAEDITNQKSLAKAIESFSETKMKSDMFFLALECNSQFGQGKYCDPTTHSVHVNIPSAHELYNGRPLSREERKSFDGYLEGYFGLIVANQIPPNRGGTSFYVRPK